MMEESNIEVNKETLFNNFTLGCYESLSNKLNFAPKSNPCFENYTDNSEVVDPDASLDALRSNCTWESLNIPPEFLKGLHAKGYVKPSKIQALALPIILNTTKNLIAQAQNGSGKTATFALAMLVKTNPGNKNPQSLCICHTRELASQNMNVIKELGEYSDITTWLVVPQCDRYDRDIGAQIIVGTPGKLREMLMKKLLPTKDVTLFILDEADVLMDHSSNMASQINEIRKAFQQKTQVLLFSATYPERVKQFVTVHVPSACRIEVKKEELTLSSVSQFYILCGNDDAKFSVLCDLYSSMSVAQSIIFVNTRKFAFHLADQMTRLGHAVSVICGNRPTDPDHMNNATREKVMLEFRKGETKVLISTDILSRGIDVPQVTLVINYDIPLDASTRFTQVDQETYIHRVGRTGRFGLQGIAISLVKTTEVPFIHEIEKFYSCQIHPLSDDPEKIEEMVSKLRQ
ncbi:uncharacterized protein LOC128883398 isoform X2 [Hylaeus volcanicus]|uniref:uncharacterized protein LOC128883398 isoform X2 n=1 Tax=Hylaeus volcanicus TaxID=313075 RepID=UPI0023B780AB|nr:uncharacterized protein LOC128883398 isoform X2 [Hylaeus volcanicus]